LYIVLETSRMVVVRFGSLGLVQIIDLNCMLQVELSCKR